MIIQVQRIVAQVLILLKLEFLVRFQNVFILSLRLRISWVRIRDSQWPTGHILALEVLYLRALL
jgi:hypothetical protein